MDETPATKNAGTQPDNTTAPEVAANVSSQAPTPDNPPSEPADAGASLDDTRDNPPPPASAPALNTLDLGQLQNFSFGTQWTQTPKTTDRRPRRDDRPHDRTRDRRGFKPRSNTDTRPDNRNDRPDRQPRRDDNRPDRRRTPDTRAPRRDDRANTDRRPFARNREEPARPIPPAYNVNFYPEDTAFETLAKVIRTSCRTYQLFDIANVVLEKNDRFVAQLQHKPAPKNTTATGTQEPAPKPAPFAISLPDGIPFENEQQAIAHILEKHLDQYFDTAEIEIDAPKGNFQVINRCTLTNTLIAPPNYHLYNQLLQQHHTLAGIRLPFDTYARTKIETIRDPEQIAQWLEKMKKATRYTWKLTANTVPPVGAALARALPDNPPSPETQPAAENNSDNPPTSGTDVSPVDGAAANVGASLDDARENPDTENTPTSENTEENTPTPEVAANVSSQAPSFTTLEDARDYLLANARDKAIRTVHTLRVHGKLLDKLPQGEIRRSIEISLAAQRRFPLETANGLRGRLRREHYTIFKKGSKGVSYVCAVKRKFRIPGQTFADTIQALIDYIEANPMIRAGQLPAKFLNIAAPTKTQRQPNIAEAVRTETATPSEPAEPNVAANVSSQAPSTETPDNPPTDANVGASLDDARDNLPTPTSEGTPANAPAPGSDDVHVVETPPTPTPDATLTPEEQTRLARMRDDLRWLVSAGYVTEFIDGRLFAPPIKADQPKKVETADGEEIDTENYPEAPAEPTDSSDSSEVAANVSSQAPAPEPAPSDAAPANVGASLDDARDNQPQSDKEPPLS